MFDDFFSKAHELTQQGVPFATAMVVWAERPTSGKPGDKAIITTEGTMYGWIGGSCAQPTVVKEALAALREDASRLIRLATEPERQVARSGVVDYPMTCYSGGTLEIYIEPHHPRPRLLIIGTLPVARALAHLGNAMNYHIIGVDLDAIAQGDAPGLPHADLMLTKLETAVAEVTPNTYVVVATHGNYDELALAHLLPAEPIYVGLVASQRRAQAVRDYLRGQGITEGQMHVLKAPAGLDIHARRGDEIALSIMAEIVQSRRNAEIFEQSLLPSQVAREVVEKAAETDACCADSTPTEAVAAIDPICRMTVEIARAKFTSSYAGISYYFCCAGCKQTFDAAPEAYLATTIQ